MPAIPAPITATVLSLLISGSLLASLRFALEPRPARVDLAAVVLGPRAADAGHAPGAVQEDARHRVGVQPDDLVRDVEGDEDRQLAEARDRREARQRSHPGGPEADPINPALHEGSPLVVPEEVEGGEQDEGARPDQGFVEG